MAASNVDFVLATTRETARKMSVMLLGKTFRNQSLFVTITVYISRAECLELSGILF